MRVVLLVLVIYLIAYVIVVIPEWLNYRSVPEVILTALFLPIIIIWEPIGHYSYRAVKRKYKQRLKKDFGTNFTHSYELRQNPEAQFLFVTNSVRRFFNVWLYALFGIKRKVREKDDVPNKYQQKPRPTAHIEDDE